MSEISLAPLTPAEADAVALLARAIWIDTYSDIIAPAQIDYMLEQRYNAARLREEFEKPGFWWDQALVAGERVGFAASCLTGAAGEIKLDKLYVLPGFQRRGIGAALLARTLAHGAAAGCTTLILAVNKHNERAIAAYRKHGFAIRESVCVDIGGGFVMDDFIMAKSIPGRG